MNGEASKHKTLRRGSTKRKGNRMKQKPRNRKENWRERGGGERTKREKRKLNQMNEKEEEGYKRRGSTG